MKFGKSLNGIFLIVAAVLIGLVLVLLPNWILTNYDRALSLGSFWGMLYLIVVGFGALLLTGLSLWTVWKLWGASLLKKRRRTRRNKNPSELSIGQRQSEIDENISQVQKLAAQAKDGSNLKGQLDPLLKEIEDKREAQTLEIVAFGTISSGKSSVLNLLAGRDVFATDARGGTTVTRNEIPWPGIDKVTLVDTPGIGEIDGAGHVNIAAESEWKNGSSFASTNPTGTQHRIAKNWLAKSLSKQAASSTKKTSSASKLKTAIEFARRSKPMEPKSTKL